MRLSKQAADKIKKAIISEMLFDGDISLDVESLEQIAGHVAKQLPAPKVTASRADLLGVVEQLPRPKDGIDGKDGKNGQNGVDGRDLLFTEAIRADLIETVSNMVDTEKIAGKATELIKIPEAGTIAKIAADLVKLPEVRADLQESQIEQLLTSEEMARRFVTRKSFVDRLEVLKKDLQDNKPINAGISGGDMAGAITQFLGSDDWKTSAVQNEFTDDLFRVVYNGGTNSKLAFDLSSIPVDTLRTLEPPSTDGTIVVAESILGYIDGLTPTFVDTTNISLSSGVIEINGKFLSLDANTVVPVTGLQLIQQTLYLYGYDSSGLSWLWSPEVPVYDSVKKGWYNTSDERAFAWVFSPMGVAAVDYFTCVSAGGKDLEYVFDRKQLALNMVPNGAWQTPNISDTDGLTPVFAHKARIGVVNFRGPSAYASPSWINAEGSSVIAGPGATGALTSWAESILLSTFIPAVTDRYVRRWDALGASRQIRVSDNSTNLAYLSAVLEGVVIGR